MEALCYDMYVVHDVAGLCGVQRPRYLPVLVCTTPRIFGVVDDSDHDGTLFFHLISTIVSEGSSGNKECRLVGGFREVRVLA